MASGGDTLWGDSWEMYGNARGGNDTLIGGDALLNSCFYGDTGFMAGDSRGGNDTVLGGSGLETFLHGDAGIMLDTARGGNDHLTAGDSTFSSLHGDARIMVADSRGGNDTLTGSAGQVSYLFGDAFDMRDNARGGDDTLISGTGTDHMWGAGQVLNGVAASPTAGAVVTGADTFVFAPGNGDDFVHDLRPGDQDRIDVSAWGFQSLADMPIVDTGVDTRIEFDAANSVTLVDFGDPATLQAADFIFA
jgi:serralysin